MNKHIYTFAAFKIFFGLLAISAVVTEILTLNHRGVFDPGNFFSYFTIQSNIFAGTVLVVGAILLLAERASIILDLCRGAATLYMVTTGIVFSLLLSGLPADQLTAVPWDNIVLHYILPIVLLVDWVFDPPKHAIPFKHALVWLAYPLLYIVYSMVRGGMIGWYPYPFLDPTQGYGPVVAIALYITLGALGMAWLLLRDIVPTRLSTKRKR